MLIKQNLQFTIYVICGSGTHFMTHVVVSPHLYVCDIAGKVQDNSSVLKLKDRLYSNAEGS